MTVPAPIVYLGPAALAVASTSLLAGAALALGAGRLSHLAPAPRERILAAAAWCPLFLGVLFVGGGLADVLVFSGACRFCRPATELVAHPSVLLLAVFGLVAARVVVGGTRVAVAIGRACRLARGLQRVARPLEADCRLLPLDEPQAFVLGLWRPRVYISRGLLRSAEPRDLAAVLAHERAHRRRRDPLRRLVASLGLLFHLPFVARRLEQHLTLAQEIAADMEAARRVGDRVWVAETLVRFSRQRPGSPLATVEFGCDDLRARVVALLDPAPPRRGPSAATFLTGALTLVAAALLAAHPLHFLGQVLLRLP